MNMKTLLIGTIFGASMTLFTINIFAYMVNQSKEEVKKSLKVKDYKQDDPL